MKVEGRWRNRAAALFALGFVLLNYPLLSIVAGGTAAGWPVLWLFLTGVWALLIAATAWLAEGD